MKQTILLLGIVCMFLTSGCLGLVSNEKILTSLNVEVNENLLTIETVYEQGELVSTSTVTFDIDFSKSTSDVSIETFGLETDDGRFMAFNADEQQTASLEFSQHGRYSVTLFAIDSTGVNITESKELIVEQVLSWTENDAGAPESLYFDATPGNDGNPPSYLILNSTVTNPSSLLEPNGRDVDIEWAVLNIDGQCMGHREIIENGDSFTWNTLHFSPMENHEVKMTIHEGQDSVDVEHRIELQYTE